jgi:hypothetical protein
MKITYSVTSERGAAIMAASCLTPGELARAVLTDSRVTDPAILAAAGRVLGRGGSRGRADPADLNRLQAAFVRLRTVERTAVAAR